MRPPGTADQLRKRREHAIQRLKRGKSPATVARAVSASRSSILRWQSAYREQGAKGLQARPIPGRPAHLSAKQRAKLEHLLLNGPLAAGYQTDLWTLQRVARLIRQHFGVRYHPGHVWKVLRRLGWSCQKPERRPTQRDEVAIAHWRRYVWPQLKKSGAAGRTPGFCR
jgi:transposase